jgi:hypothetical protein
VFAAMQTNDFVSAKTRGFVSVTPATVPPGPSGAKPPRNPLRIAIGLGVAVFVLGIALGAGVQTLRLKRRYRRGDARDEKSAAVGGS